MVGSEQLEAERQQFLLNYIPLFGELAPHQQHNTHTQQTLRILTAPVLHRDPLAHPQHAVLLQCPLTHTPHLLPEVLPKPADQHPGLLVEGERV